MEEYDYVIPLGYNCTLSNALIYGKFRENSYPFDWLLSKMWKINETFNNGFNNFFVLSNLIIARYTGNPSKEKDDGYTYVHDGSYNDLTSNVNFYTMHYNKYKRRIDKLKQICNSKKRVLFLRIVYEETYEDHINFINIFKQKYPNCKFKLICFLPDNHTIKNTELKNENLLYVPKLTLNIYNISGYLEHNYKLPKYKQLEKTYY